MRRLAAAEERSSEVIAGRARSTQELAECAARLERRHDEVSPRPNSRPNALRRNVVTPTRPCATRTDVASRTHARAETLARAFEELSGAAGRSIVGDLEGVLGSFLELIEVDAGAEAAVESAAGASASAMVVDGKRSARAALDGASP